MARMSELPEGLLVQTMADCSHELTRRSGRGRLSIAPIEGGPLMIICIARNDQDPKLFESLTQCYEPMGPPEKLNDWREKSDRPEGKN